MSHRRPLYFLMVFSLELSWERAVDWLALEVFSFLPEVVGPGIALPTPSQDFAVEFSKMQFVVSDRSLQGL